MALVVVCLFGCQPIFSDKHGCCINQLIAAGMRMFQINYTLMSILYAIYYKSCASKILEKC